MFKAGRCRWCKMGAPDCEVETIAGPMPGHRGKSMMGVPCDVPDEWRMRGWRPPQPRGPARI